MRREAKGREELDKELENKDEMEKTKKQEKPDVLKKTKQQEELNVMKNVMEREEKNPPNEDIFSNKAGKAMEFKKVGNLTMFPDRYLVALKRALAALKRALVINMIDLIIKTEAKLKYTLKIELKNIRKLKEKKHNNKFYQYVIFVFENMFFVYMIFVFVNVITKNYAS